MTKISEHITPTYTLDQDLIQFLMQALEESDTSRVQDLVSGIHTADLAEFISIIDNDHREQLFSYLPDIDPEVLIDLDPEIKDRVIGLLGTKKSAEAIAQLESDDAVQVMEDLEIDDQEDILDAIPEEHRETLKEDLSHADDTAGRIKNRSFIAIPSGWTVGDTIDYLRTHDELPDNFYEIFVVDDSSKPIGGVLVSHLLRRERNILIKNIMETHLKIITPNMDQEDVAYTFQKYTLKSAPVVDKLGIITGVISIDDIVDVIEEEAEEDIMHMGGIDESDLYATFIQTALNRFPWLFINLITAIAASAVITLFEESIEKLVALAVLMPIVASMAGNAGTQTLTIAVRAIATRELTSVNAKRVVIKEISASIVNGLFFAIIVGTVSFALYSDIHLSIVFATATVAALIIAAFAGASIPLILVKAGVDPAIASVVLLTTVTDITAFFIFLGLASWMLI